jgi:putative membrane protein
MAWIRTCLSLISFGFGLDKIVGAINRTRLGASSHADLTVRLVAMSFILTGIVAMAAATRQHRRNLILLGRADYTYGPQTSIGTGTALALMAIGTVSLLTLIWGALP